MISAALSRALLLLTLTQISAAVTIPSSLLPPPQTLLKSAFPQHISVSNPIIMASERQPVLGDNPAYYSGSTPPGEQLFKIEEFVVAPNPPPMNRRFFGYIVGRLPNDLPDLENAILELVVGKDDEEPRSYVDEFGRWPLIIFRQRFKYGHELKPGVNEIIADYIFISPFIHAGNYTFTAEATLPDGRVLFCFEASMYLKGEL